MRATSFPFQSRKSVAEGEEVVSYKLMTQAGFIVKHGSGLFTYGPFATKILDTLRGIIRRELDAAGCVEISMPFVQPASLWQESGRWDLMGPEMARFEDRREASFALAPTHEEVVTDVFRQSVTSYKQLPLCLYQINPKFRDEIRPRFGLLRAREFLMMDAYSFHMTSESLDETYDRLFAAYERVFTACGVKFAPVEASVGNMGGSSSHEFHVIADTGEDEIYVCSGCGFVSNKEIWVPTASGDAVACPHCASAEHETKRGIEVGHIFKLGRKYTESMGAGLAGGDGKRFYPLMGCYGIGVSRVVAAVIEQNHDAKGMKWPARISPIDVSLVTAVSDERALAFARGIYEKLLAAKVAVFWDDRDAGFGQKVRDWELLGFPKAVVIGKGWLESGKMEILDRATGEKRLVEADGLEGLIREMTDARRVGG